MDHSLPEQLHQLTEAIRASNLDPKIGEMLIDNISGNQWLVVDLESVSRSCFRPTFTA